MCVCGHATLLLPLCLECSKLEILELEVEGPTEVDIPDEPIQAAVYEQVSIVIHLRKTELESLMRKAESRQQWRTWIREGELWWYAVTARPGLLHWPAIPQAQSSG